MISTIGINKRYFFELITFLMVLSTSGFLPPQESRYSMHTLNTIHPPRLNIHDDSLLVRGVYWELPLAGVHTLNLDSNKLEVIGDSVSPSGVVHLTKIIHKIPHELVATKLVSDTSGVWFESDAISCYGGNFLHCYWTFYKFSSGQSFCYEEPSRSYYQILHLYLGRQDTAVFTMAFGKMNQDTTKWMGYIIVTRRYP